MKTIFENNGGAYTQVGDYLLPNLSLPVEEKETNIDVWTMRHKRYLKQNHKVRYYNLLTSGKLNSYLADIEEQAQNLFSRLVKDLAEKENVMEKLKPKLFSVMKSYTKEQFVKDVIAGIIVAIIALPLSIALAIASGVGPVQGLYTAIVAGFVISALGGSSVQIAGPTAAFATIVAGIIAKDGLDGLVISTILAGIFLILMGFCHFGSLIKFIPYTITTGFTSGIAVTIVIGQLKDFFGITYPDGVKPIETTEKFKAFAENISTINTDALIVGIVSLAILIISPMLLKRIPGSLIAVIVGSLMVQFLPLKVSTIGNLYTISNSLPSFHLPEVNVQIVQNAIPNAFTIAVLAAIESLLSCVVADGMINGKHRSDMELVAQGAGNIASALFGGIPATGAIARTAAR